MPDRRERAPSADLPATERATTPQRRTSKGLDKRERARLAVTAVLAALVAAFALLNLDKIEVNWIVASGRAPLIIVIALSFVAGMAVDRLLRVAAKRRRR